MRLISSLLITLFVAGCSVQTATFYAPIRIETAEAAQRFVVIRNLNRPRDCRIVPEDSVYPAVYAIAYGPAAEGAAEGWARRNCASL